MIGWLLLAAAAMTNPPAPGVCAGIAVNTPSGRANFIWITGIGDDAALARFRSAAATIRNVEVQGPRAGPDGRNEVTVVFQTVKNRPQETTDPADAAALLRRARAGEFGQLDVQPMVMPMDTLPADLC
jgi:hypothetical protein